MKVISLGNNCDIAQMLRYNNLRKEGYPFDWIWTSIDFLIETFTTDYFVFTECEKLICKSEFNGNSDTYIEYNNNNNNSYNELSSNNKLIKNIKENLNVYILILIMKIKSYLLEKFLQQMKYH